MKIQDKFWKVGYLRSCRHLVSSSDDGKEKDE